MPKKQGDEYTISIMCKSILNNRPDISVLLWQKLCLTIVDTPRPVIDSLLAQIEDSARLFEFKAFLFAKLICYMTM